MINFTNFVEFIHFKISKFTIDLIATPCHTLDSICILIKNNDTLKSYVATGDFIFKLGCGKFFEGNAEMFIKSLDNLVSYLDENTLLLYGHDYFETNRKFTEMFYPVVDCNHFFLTLKKEKKFNPFFKVMDIQELSGSREERVSKLRDLKDNFKSH